MTDQAPSTDPITSILVLVTEIRGEVRAALADLKRHDGDISQLFSGQNDLRDRVTKLEATAVADEQNEGRTYSGKSIAWAAAAVAVSAVSTFVAILLAVKGA